MPIRRSDRSIERFWNESAGYLFDVVDGEQGNDPACRPNQIFAISLDHPVLDQRHWKPVLNIVSRKTSHAGRLAIVVAGPPRFQSPLFRRFAVARRGLSSGDGVGVADRALHRCLVARPCRRFCASPRVSEGIRRSPERRMRRFDQRSLRRRAALYAARLHRAGVECGRGPARLDQNRSAGRHDVGIRAASEPRPGNSAKRRPRARIVAHRFRAPARAHS